ncbi:hypothetical protein ACXO7E_02975, partial [Lactobacillus delbrueckii subsp. bulgaricus]
TTRLQKSTLTPNLTAFTGVDSQNLPDVMVSVQFILAIGVYNFLINFFAISTGVKKRPDSKEEPQ